MGGRNHSTRAARKQWLMMHQHLWRPVDKLGEAYTLMLKEGMYSKRTGKADAILGLRTLIQDLQKDGHI